MVGRMVLLAALVAVLALGTGGCTSEDASSGDGAGRGEGDAADSDRSPPGRLSGKTEQVRLGQTGAEVEALLGPPRTTLPLDGEGGVQKMWDDGAEWFVVGIADGRVVMINGGQHAPDQPDSRLAENFPKVQVGMVPEQVRDLLGPATTAAETASAEGAFQVWTWQGDARTYVVNFADGKVTAVSEGER